MEYIKSLGDNKVLTLKDVTHKLATIMVLANASHDSEIYALNASETHAEGVVGCSI